MSAKTEANVLAKAIAAIDSIGFCVSEDIADVRNTLRDLLINRGYMPVESGSSRTRALTKDNGPMWRQYQSSIANVNGTQIECKRTITYRWWRDDNKEIPGSHVSELETTANDVIELNLKEGWYSGEMHCTVSDMGCMVTYNGAWEVK